MPGNNTSQKYLYFIYYLLLLLIFIISNTINNNKIPNTFKLPNKFHNNIILIITIPKIIIKTI